MSKYVAAHGPSQAQPLLIAAAGATCALGHTLAAASCALRAGMDHFQESSFVDSNATPLKVARLQLQDAAASTPDDNPLPELWGAKRLARLAVSAVIDCVNQTRDHPQPGIDARATVLILLAAERDRPHTEEERYQECYEAITDALKVPFHPASKIVSWGRAGLGPALQTAHQLLTGHAAAGGMPIGIKHSPVQQVLLVGVDSFLNAATVQHYLADKRLLVPGNADGFIPGEAAAALLLRLGDGRSQGTLITGLGLAREAAGIDGAVPNRAVGLTQAIRAACASAQTPIQALSFRMSDQNGEQFFSREAGNAVTRVMMDAVTTGAEGVHLQTLHIADCVGETGAAAGPLMLAYLSELMTLADEVGDVGLLHLANDDGARTALTVEYRY